MSNKDLHERAIGLANQTLKSVDFISVSRACHGMSAVQQMEVHDIITRELAAQPKPQVIRTREELEALELDDADAIVLASEAGAVRTVRALCAMHRLGRGWGLPAVVIATGGQVRAAREAMEQGND